GLPAAGVGDGQRAGDVGAVHFQVEGAAGAAGGDAKLNVVAAGAGDVDGVLEPLASLGPADVVAAARVGRGLDVHAVGAVLAAVVGCIGVVVGDALAAVVVILGLDHARDRPRRAAVRLVGRRVDHQCRGVAARAAGGVRHDCPVAAGVRAGRGADRVS